MQTTLDKGDDPPSSSFSRLLGVLAPIFWMPLVFIHIHLCNSLTHSQLKTDTTWVSFLISVSPFFPLSPSPSSVDYSVITAPGCARAHRPLWVFRIRQHPGNATRLRHKSKTDMKHCRHAITVKLEACNVCIPAGNMRLTDCQFNSAHNFSIILCKFSFSFYPAPKQSWGILLSFMCLQQVPQSVPLVALYTNGTWCKHRILNLYCKEYDLIPRLRHFTVRFVTFVLYDVTILNFLQSNLPLINSNLFN